MNSISIRSNLIRPYFWCLFVFWNKSLIDICLRFPICRYLIVVFRLSFLSEIIRIDRFIQETSNFWSMDQKFEFFSMKRSLISVETTSSKCSAIFFRQLGHIWAAADCESGFQCVRSNDQTSIVPVHSACPSHSVCNNGKCACETGYVDNGVECEFSK